MDRTAEVIDWVKKKLPEATAEFYEVLDMFPANEFNTVPFEGSWTPARVIEHVHKSDMVMLKLLEGPSKSDSRPVDQHVDDLKKTFLNFDVKLQSPDFIFPEDKPYDKKLLVSDLKETRNKITEMADKNDLSKTLTSFSFPGSGELTALEVLTFVICHTKRHAFQLSKMTKQMKEHFLSNLSEG